MKTFKLFPLRLAAAGVARSGTRDHSRFDGAAPRDPRASPGLLETPPTFATRDAHWRRLAFTAGLAHSQVAARVSFDCLLTPRPRDFPSQVLHAAARGTIRDSTGLLRAIRAPLLASLKLSVTGSARSGARDYSRFLNPTNLNPETVSCVNSDSAPLLTRCCTQRCGGLFAIRRSCSARSARRSWRCCTPRRFWRPGRGGRRWGGASCQRRSPKTLKS